VPGSSAASGDHRKKAVTMYLNDIIFKEHTKLKSSLSPPAQAATSEAQTPSTSSAGADVSQPEPSQPPNKKLRLLENLNSEPENEPVDSIKNEDIHNVLKEIAAYLHPQFLLKKRNY